MSYARKWPTSTALSVGVCLLGAMVANGQTIWHVDDDAVPGGDGLSWATAFADLQDGLAVALADDEIWVAAGTYTPTVPDGDRTISFDLKNGVGLFGGFAGSETERDQRDSGQTGGNLTRRGRTVALPGSRLRLRFAQAGSCRAAGRSALPFVRISRWPR